MTTISTVCFSIKFILRIFGVWPDASCLALMLRLFWTVLLTVTLILQYTYAILHFHTDNMTDLMDTISTCLAYNLLLIKLIIFWINQRKFHNILTKIAADWKECANDPFSAHVTTSMASLSHRFSNTIIGVHMVAVVTYSLGAFLSNRDDNFNASTIPVRMFIINMEFPFDSNSTPVYELVIVMQFIQLVLNACAIDVINALIMTLILHVSGQIDILHEWLTNIFSKDSIRDMTEINMKTLIGKHQKIILFAEDVEDLYCYIALMQFVSITLIICSIGFVIISSIDSPDTFTILVKTLMFYIVMNLEAFTFCFAGEYLSSKSQNIADAAYGSLWYNEHVNENRIVTFLILRSQKRLTITIGKVADLSLERFASIIKASASYISVLLAMS